MGISALLASQILDASATGRSVITGADASAIRTTLGLGTLATQSPTGTPSASTFLRGDYSWQTIDLSGYVPYTGAAGAVDLGSNAFTASRATLSTGTITASTPAINVTQTWNSAATTFTGILANVTDTASNAASLLLDLQVGGTSRFSVSKAGVISAPGGSGAAPSIKVGSQQSGLFASTNQLHFVCDGFSRAYVDSNSVLNIQYADFTQTNSYVGFSNGSAYLYSEGNASNAIGQRRTTNAQAFRVYNTFTDSSNYERAKIAWESNILRIGTEKAGTGSARALELQTDGVTRLTIGSGANHVLTLPDNASIVGGTGTVFRFRYWNSTDNSITFFDCYNTSGFATFSLGATNPRLNFGGTTSSFPAIKRNSAAINFRLADDSADCDIAAKAATFSGNVTVSAVNLVTDTTTGTKIGTATNQKLGFFNATPVVQPTAVADATDAASVITQLNALLSRMRDLGLIAT